MTATTESIKRVALIGGTGTLGLPVLKALQSSNDPEPFEKILVLSRAAVHGSSTSTSVSASAKTTVLPPHPRTTLIHTSYDTSALTEIFRTHRIDAVISTTGLAGVSAQRDFIDACVASGVVRYVTNDSGNAPDYAGLVELEAARAPKQEILEVVRAAAETHPGFSWTAVATGHFFDVALTRYSDAFGFDLATRRVRVVDGGDERFSATVLGDVGGAVVGVLRGALAETRNRWCLVRSAEFTQNHVLAALRRVMDSDGDGGKWEVEEVESGDLLERGREKVRNGDARGGMMDLLPVQLYQAGAGRSITDPERYDNELLGVRERGVEEVVEEVLREWNASCV